MVQNLWGCSVSPHNLQSIYSWKGHLLLRASQWFQRKIKDLVSHLGLIDSVSISEGLELPMQLIARDIFQLADTRSKSKPISRCPPPRPSLDLLAPLAICFSSCLVVRQVAKKPSAQNDENRSGVINNRQCGHLQPFLKWSQMAFQLWWETKFNRVGKLITWPWHLLRRMNRSTFKAQCADE